MLYTESGLPQFVLTAMQKMGYTEMTPIQEKAIPVVMSGKDLIGRSQTGSGDRQGAHGNGKNLRFWHSDH